MKIIDFHTHVFPDSLAEKAMTQLQGSSSIHTVLDGRISSLLKSMENAGIEKSVICSIATRPEQFFPILEWSKLIRSEKIVPFISIHPDDPGFIEKVSIVKDEGFIGIKIHPYFQDFIFNDKKIFKFYEEIIKNNLLLLTHAGFDISFKRDNRVSPDKILEVKTYFPELKLVAAHLGGWMRWQEVFDILAGTDIYLDLSYSIDDQNPLAEKIINKHNENYLLFATDSPWASQKKYIEIVKNMNISKVKKDKIFYKNAAFLFN